MSVEHLEANQKLAGEFSSVRFLWLQQMLGGHEEIGAVLEGINQLANVFIRESLDDSRPNGTGKAPLAYFGPKELEPKGTFKCPEQLGGPKCLDCGLCWRTDGSVVFLVH